MTRLRSVQTPAVLLLALLSGGVVGWVAARRAAPTATTPRAALAVDKDPNGPIPTDNGNNTVVYAHNILLRKGPDFKVYIRWIRGEMKRTRQGEVPSFDDPDSFVLEIQKGVIYAGLDDLARYLNSGTGSMPLTDIAIAPADHDQVKIHGTVHKLIPLPVELDGQLTISADDRIRLHVNKIDVLKVPLKGFLGLFHVQLDDLVKGRQLPGIQIAGNDILFNTEVLLPPPHIHGHVSAVHVQGDRLAVLYGDSPDDDTKLAQWHNFFRLRGGELNFARLTMHDVDLTMIDASNDTWFDLDLVHYQAQLVNGYTRMTAQAGLEIYMPDLDEIKQKQPGAAVTLDWLKNRHTTVPADVPQPR